MIKKKKVMFFLLVSLLLTPLTIFYILDGSGVFDTRSKASRPDVLPVELARGDLNSDSIVNMTDFNIWLNDFRDFKKSSSAYREVSDLVGDKKITISDFALWLETFRGFKAYRADPQGYLASMVAGVSAHYTFDQHAGTGSFLRDKSGNGVDASLIGSEFLKNGFSGGSHIFDTIGSFMPVEGGADLPFDMGSWSTSFFMNPLGSDFSSVIDGENPFAFLWDQENSMFRMMPIEDLDFDLSELTNMMEDIDISEDMMGEWMNWTTSFGGEKNFLEYFLNGELVGSVDVNSSSFDLSEMIPLFVGNGKTVAVDEMVVYNYAASGSSASDILSSPHCSRCSSNYQYVMAHYDIKGWDSEDYPTDAYCREVSSGLKGDDGELLIEKLYYTCAYTQCSADPGYNNPNDTYPGWVRDQDPNSPWAPLVGHGYISDEVSYLSCKPGVEGTPYPSPHCSDCSSNYKYLLATWDIKGYISEEKPSDELCRAATDGQDTRAEIKPGSLVYSCKETCNIKGGTDVYPGEVATGSWIPSNLGINTREEYEACINLHENSPLTE